MALSDKGFVDKINSCLTGTLSEIHNAQLADSTSKISSYKIDSVATFAVLPPAFENTGRMVFVVSEDVYYFSDGASWTKDLTSNLVTALYSWGAAYCGKLGDGTIVNKCSPVSVIGGITDWCQVSSGNIHTVALRSSGLLLAWGSNGNGRLGDGTTVDKCSPVSVVGGFTDWCQVSAGSQHTSAVRTDGSLWDWGFNNNGQLGDGTTVDKCSPVSVIGGGVSWCQVSTGKGYFSLAVRTNGTLWAWGSGVLGRLGDGTTVNKSSPVAVAGGFTDWCQVSGGNQHAAAIRTNGTLWAWGSGSDGRLGAGNQTDRCSPVAVVGGFTDWCQVETDTGHTAGVRTNGSLWLWGRNTDGQLGDGTTLAKCSPVSVVGGFTDWCQVSLPRGDHTIAVRTNGSAWAWGLGTCGRLGDGTTVNKCSPVAIVGGFTDWCQVSTGSDSNSALRYTKGF